MSLIEVLAKIAKEKEAKVKESEVTVVEEEEDITGEEEGMFLMSIFEKSKGVNKLQALKDLIRYCKEEK